MYKRQAAQQAVLDPGKITFENLKDFDGSSGKPACIIHDRKIYDVTESPKWKNGRHFGKHSAGMDLTEAIKGAPHGLEVLEKVKFVAEVKGEEKQPEKMSGTRKLFVFMAYSVCGNIHIGCARSRGSGKNKGITVGLGYNVVPTRRDIRAAGDMKLVVGCRSVGGKSSKTRPTSVLK